MEKMKKTRLALSLAGVLGVSLFAGNASAVNQAADGVGELAYVPYFSITKGQEEHIKVVNTSNLTVAVKIVFRRGTDSREVRDFNIILSPYDVWTGKVVPSSAGNAKLVTSDNSCTVPNKDQWTAEAGGYSVDFDSTLFGQKQGIQEGYTYVAVMGVSGLSTSLANSVPYLAKHVGGKPRDCGAIDWGFANALDSVIGQFSPPEDVIRVTSSLVDVTGGSSVEVPVTTFANAFNNGQKADRLQALGVNNVTVSSVEQPDETFVSPATSDIFIDKAAQLASANFDSPQRALSTVIMANQVIGSYDTTDSQTSNWIVNFPTKRKLLLLTDISPFEGNSVTIEKQTFDEEEETSINTTRFSPNLHTSISLPWEVNVVGFNNNNSLASGLFTDSVQGFAKGWMSMTFPKARAVTSGDGRVTYTGMPVIGFELNEGKGIASSAPLSYTKGIVVKQ